jgi:hypothetical protein
LGAREELGPNRGHGRIVVEAAAVFQQIALAHGGFFYIVAAAREE